MGRPKSPRVYRAPRFTHKCAAADCVRLIDSRWRFCREHSGVDRRRDDDAMRHRVPGSVTQ